jgi:hypothetical protein
MMCRIHVAGWRALLLITVIVMVMAIAGATLAACSGGRGKAARSVAPAADDMDNSIGIWSGTLDSDDPAQPPLSGWLVIAPDGSFHLDTDAAMFSGSAQSLGSQLAATATGHPYGADIPAGGAFTFMGKVAKGALNGTWSGTGRGGRLDFQQQNAVSHQAASLATIASTYDGEIWIGKVAQPAQILVDGDGTLTVTTGSGCRASGTVAIADASRNRYQWTATLSSCSVDGLASGSGFMVGNYSIYFSGRLPDAGVWLGGVDADAQTPLGN